MSYKWPLVRTNKQASVRVAQTRRLPSVAGLCVGQLAVSAVHMDLTERTKTAVAMKEVTTLAWTKHQANVAQRTSVIHPVRRDFLGIKSLTVKCLDAAVRPVELILASEYLVACARGLEMASPLAGILMLKRLKIMPHYITKSSFAR